IDDGVGRVDDDATAPRRRGRENDIQTLPWDREHDDLGRERLLHRATGGARLLRAQLGDHLRERLGAAAVAEHDAAARVQEVTRHGAADGTGAGDADSGVLWSHWAFECEMRNEK